MSLIQTRTAPEAWFEATRFLRRECHDNETFDLFIQIAEPTFPRRTVPFTMKSTRF